MSQSIELFESKMSLQYRVMGYFQDGKRIVFSGDSKKSAEDFCWTYKGAAQELKLGLYWVKKGTEE